MKKFLTLSCVAMLALSACNPSDFVANLPQKPDLTMNVWVNADVKNGKMGDNATMIAGYWDNPLEEDHFVKMFSEDVFFPLLDDNDYWDQKRFLEKDVYVWATPYEYLSDKNISKADNGKTKWLTGVDVKVADATPSDETIEVTITRSYTEEATRTILEATTIPGKFFVSTAFAKDWDFKEVGLTKDENPYGDGLDYYYPGKKEDKEYTGYIVVETTKLTLLPQAFPKFTTHRAFGDYFTIYAPLNAKGEVTFENIPTPKNGLVTWPEKLYIEGKTTLGKDAAMELKILDVTPPTNVGVVQYLQEPNKARGLVHPNTYNAQVLAAIDAFVDASDYKQTKVKITIDKGTPSVITYVRPYDIDGVPARPANYTLGLTL